MKTALSLVCLLLCGSLAFALRPIDVVLIGGQSNATGQGYVRNLPQSFTLNKDVLLWHSATLNGGPNSARRWLPLRPASESPDRFGVELSLGTALARRFPNRHWALIKHGLSGSDLHTLWAPGNGGTQKPGREYRLFIETVREALAALRAEGYDPHLRGMVWQQGEADARFDAPPTSAQTYGQRLRAFIEAIRRDLNAPDLPFLYGTVMPLPAKRFTGRDLVRQGQRQVSENSGHSLATPGAHLIPADDLQMRCTDWRTPYPKDDVHLGTFGLLTLGERFAAALPEPRE